MSEKSYRDAIRDAMMEEMDRDANVLVMGEDIGVYEGTFRITAGMLKKYGPKRVIDIEAVLDGLADALEVVARFSRRSRDEGEQDVTFHQRRRAGGGQLPVANDPQRTSDQSGRPVRRLTRM